MKLKCCRGGAMVETAIVLPLLIIMVVGIIQIGMIINARLIVGEAAREAAREFATYDKWDNANKKIASIVGSDNYNATYSKGSSYVTVEVKCMCPVFVPGVEQLISGDDVWGEDGIWVSGKAVFRKEEHES